MTKLKQRIKDKLGEQKTAKLKKTWRVVRIVKNIVCWTLIAMLTLSIIVFTLTKINGDSPSFFGYSLHRIMSGSMEPELVINDVILNKDVSDPSDVRLGDIITFEGGPAYDYKSVTHRVIVAPYDNGRGRMIVVTKGDSNDADDGEIDFSTVQSKYLRKINFLSHIYNFFFSKWGLLIFIGLLLLIFFDEIVNIIKIISASRQEKPESISEIIERMQREQREAMAKKKQEQEQRKAEESVQLPDAVTPAEKKEEQSNAASKNSTQKTLVEPLKQEKKSNVYQPKSKKNRNPKKKNPTEGNKKDTNLSNKKKNSNKKQSNKKKSGKKNR